MQICNRRWMAACISLGSGVMPRPYTLSMYADDGVAQRTSMMADGSHDGILAFMYPLLLVFVVSMFFFVIMRGARGCSCYLPQPGVSPVCIMHKYIPHPSHDSFVA